MVTIHISIISKHPLITYINQTVGEEAFPECSI